MFLHLTLLPPGEHLFLCGFYAKSADAWRSQICEESNKSKTHGFVFPWKCKSCSHSVWNCNNKNRCPFFSSVCDRRVFQEERICLGLLYSLLTQYRLREAQELGDHMARLILHRAGHQKENKKSITGLVRESFSYESLFPHCESKTCSLFSLPLCLAADSLPCMWLPTDLHNDAACAVIQSLGRFMASYFANQPLQILPPHNVAVLPPLHLPHGTFHKVIHHLSIISSWYWLIVILSPKCWALGAAMPGGGGYSSSTTAPVRGVDSGLRPWPAPAWGSASWGRMAGVPSRGLEDSGFSESGLQKLLHWQPRLRSVSVKQTIRYN